MISEPELSRLAALIAQCAEPHCGNGPRNSLTSALHQCAPALIPELRRLRSQNDALREALQAFLDAFEGPACCSAYTATGRDAMPPLLSAAESARAALASTEAQ